MNERIYPEEIYKKWVTAGYTPTKPAEWVTINFDMDSWDDCFEDNSLDRIINKIREEINENERNRNI